MVFRQLGRPLLGVRVRLPVPSPSSFSAAGRYCPWSRVTFRPWAVFPWKIFPAHLYSILLISPNFLGKAENPEGKGTPKLKVSLRHPWITSHYPLSKNRCFQELWWGTLNIWEPAPLPISFHLPTARGSGWPLRAGRLLLALMVVGNTAQKPSRRASYGSRNMATG